MSKSGWNAVGQASFHGADPRHPATTSDAVGGGLMGQLSGKGPGQGCLRPRPAQAAVGVLRVVG